VSETQSRRAKVWAVLRVASGNCLEMYDLMVFGYYADDIGKAFFPTGNEFVSLMSALMTFGAGYLMRPLGAVVLGAYIDQKGRRAGLLLTLGLMAIGTLSIACTPSYATIGVLAPILVVIGRLLQGFSAGVEIGGVSVYLAEIATPGNKGFYVAWQSASQQVAVIFAALLGFFLTVTVSPADMVAWGWRIPLLIGCGIIPLLFIIRGSLQETEEFAARKQRPSLPQVLSTLRTHWRIVLTGVMLVIMTTVWFYVITAYTRIFGQNLKLSDSHNLIVTVCVGLTNLILLPIMGALSDRVGRRPLLFLWAGLACVTAYPAMWWLTSEPSFTRLLLVQLWCACVFASYNGAMVVYLTEIMPIEIRTSGFALAYSLATAIFGGFTMAICETLIKLTGNQAMPGVWLSLAAFIGILGTLFSTRTAISATE
jgi:MHS family citrate/tricarballylate:H+ symporter-like MFS transporter